MYTKALKLFFLSIVFISFHATAENQELVLKSRVVELITNRPDLEIEEIALNPL